TRAEASRRGRGFNIRPIPATLGVIFILLALATAFMFSARAVRFDVSPTPASLRVSEGFPSYRLGERFLMLPGKYQIKATLPGYKILEKTVHVGSDADQDYNFKMEKLPGILRITSEPDVHPTVFIDQKKVGTAPLKLDAIEAGVHDIRLASARYLSYDTEIDIKGKRIEQTVAAKLSPAWANVTITSLPTDAVVLVDGEDSGKTPDSVQILQGSREIQLQKAGYKTFQTSIDVVAGKDQTVPKVSLVRADGKVNVTTAPAGANVTIGGRYRGQSPIAVTLAPGNSYEVLLSKVGYNAVKEKIDVAPDQDIELHEKLSPITGTLTLKVEPSGGKLFVDGKPVGEPSQRLVLTARNHDIKIVKDGFAPYTKTITPQPGFAQQLMITLQTPEEAAVAAIPEQVTTHAGETLKLIIPGDMTMGAPRREPGRRSNEIQKQVKMTRPYYLGVKEITNLEFNKFDPGHNSGIAGRALLTEDDRPVVNVSWSDAAQYCNWLSSQDGLPAAYIKKNNEWVPVSPMNTGYRLPTEAEWVWAARYAGGPHPTRFPWGDAMPPTDVAANYADESARNMVPYIIEGYNDHYRGPAPVGSFAPNQLGIYDLAGNVSEWINDFYSVDEPKGVLTDPMGPDSGNYHVIRGSNYTDGRFSELRWTYRDYGKDPRPVLGFRIARYVK
ncbi:MAG TPA: PEGA domain-containing protein, partial [Pseudomonadales bacterium]|nr:PEGA domain-containing protein [Pseudomonadales bacterium]